MKMQEMFCSIQYYLVIICPHAMLPYHTIDDFLNYGTLPSPELERLTLPVSTERGIVEYKLLKARAHF